jgi:ABC-type glutathione transport system ATPase component
MPLPRASRPCRQFRCQSAARPRFGAPNSAAERTAIFTHTPLIYIYYLSIERRFWRSRRVFPCGQITAVRDVNFALKQGGSLAIVGESGFSGCR